VILVWETFRWRKRVGKKQQELMMDTQTDIYYWQSNSCEYRKYSKHTHTHTHPHTQTHSHTYTPLHTHSHTHLHTQTHSHTHTFSLLLTLSIYLPHTHSISLALITNTLKIASIFLFFNVCLIGVNVHCTHSFMCCTHKN
jgi:hypothetical protein